VNTLCSVCKNCVRSSYHVACLDVMFMQVGFCGRDQATEDVGFVLFSFFNVLWACIYVEAWKRYSAELAYRWGTLDQRDELLVEPRPLFTVSTTGSRSMPCLHVLCECYRLVHCKKSASLVCI
jgi:hypothetical protein